MKCAGCRFWSSPTVVEVGANGECRKNPPLVLVGSAPGLAPGQARIQLQSYWPPTGANAWCGAYEPRDLPPKR